MKSQHNQEITDESRIYKNYSTPELVQFGTVEELTNEGAIQEGGDALYGSGGAG